MLNPIEIEIIEGIIEEGEVLSHTASIEEGLLEEIYVEFIKILYEGEVYEIVKHDGEFKHILRLSL